MIPKRRKPDLADRQRAAVDETLTAPATPCDPMAEVLPTSVTSVTGKQIITDAEVENALLRGSLYLTARALKDYQESPRKKIDAKGTSM